MDRDEEKLTHRIRGTMMNMHDEDLMHVIQSGQHEYTQVALRVARQEIARRGGKRALKRRLGETPALGSHREGKLTSTPADDSPTSGESTGCYIEVWRDKDFEGESLRIEVPAEVADLCSNQSGWCGQITSIRVGPRAFVLAYDDKEFKGDMIRLGPSEEVADLGNVKFDDEIDSIRIVDSLRVFDCTASKELRIKN